MWIWIRNNFREVMISGGVLAAIVGVLFTFALTASCQEQPSPVTVNVNSDQVATAVPPTAVPEPTEEIIPPTATVAPLPTATTEPLPTATAEPPATNLDTVICWHGTGESPVDYGNGEVGHEILISYPKSQVENGISLTGIDLDVPWTEVVEDKKPAAWSLKACLIDGTWYGHPEFRGWFWETQYIQFDGSQLIAATGNDGTGTVRTFSPVQDIDLPLIPTEATGNEVQIVAYASTTPDYDLVPVNYK